MSHAFYADAENKANRRKRAWYQENLLNVLRSAKEKRVREIDASIALAEELMKILNEPREKPKPAPYYPVEHSEDASSMKPIEPEVLNLLYSSTEKGAAERYLKARYKKNPEDKFFFRISSNLDYGWQQKQAKQLARDVNHGRCYVLKHTFYRKNNLAPDPPHYAQPSGGQFSICSEYSCNFN